MNAFAAEEGEDAEAEEQNEKIVITGSRIPRKELSQPSPVVTIDSAEIKKFGTTDLASMLSELAPVAATDTLQGNSGSNASAGVSSANLRNLGPERSLTLINGKRHVAGQPGTAQVDLSTIPASLVERVEISTGGQSAIYGSDAVTGVVNVVLKEDFEGFEVNMSGSKSMESVGAGNGTINILAGADYADGKGNVTFFAGREYVEEVMSRDLQHLENYGTIINPADGGEEDGIPDLLTVPFVGSEMINRWGVLNPFGPDSARWTFQDDGTPFLQQTRNETNSFAFGDFPGGCPTCFFTEDYENFLPSVQKMHVGSTTNYSFNDNVQFYGEFKYVRSEIEQQFQPSFRFGNISINVVDNPFLDGGLRATLLANGQSTVSMAKFFDELGNRSADNLRETFRVVTGVKGFFELGDTEVDYDFYYVNGRTNNRRRTLNDLIPDNLVAALDAVIDPATGQAACRSQVPSAQGTGYVDPAAINGSQCVAYNPFGFRAASTEAMDFVSADVTREDEIGQEYYGVQFVFDTAEFANLQGGPIGIALGFEEREEFSETITDSLTKSGILANAATPDEFGSYDVSESFVELQFPILEGLTGAHELTLDAAYRAADYSGAGNADTWKVGVLYAPIEDIRIRGTVGEAIRAPNISEAFSPQSPGFARVSDPCDADNLGNDPDRADNCAALGIPATFQANDNVSVNTISGGNPDLTSEVSDSTTFGIVWTPTFLEDFSVTIDKYEIDIEDAILSVAAQTVANNCVDSTGGPDANFCGQIDRDPTTFDITLVRSGFINASAIRSEGIEANVNYRFDLGEMGSIASNLYLSKLELLEFFEFQNLPEESDLDQGEVGTPEYQARLNLVWSLDDLSVSWTSRFVDRSARYNVSPPPGDTSEPEDISPSYIGSVTTHDISASYDFSSDVSVYAGIRNVGNKLPPGWTRSTIYDSIGRRFFAGATFRF
ncbi:TonB-dependent receptor [Aliikangiella marina]|uniref:TonB-dependent receptor n=2 Tax=Aliikangiella marina TaxID=1712262 RepID=A0A545TEK0_9GAMM|nr:TonB-dependent receptor [Aliikangiella marina]